MSEIKVAVVGVTGYVGSELVRLLARRPDVKLTELVGRSAAGQPLGNIFPHLAPLNLSVAAELERPAECDFIFLALPHHASAETAAQLLEIAPHTKIIDMSADFRLRDQATYEKWYGSHPAAYLLPEAVYGLPELYRNKVKPGVRLIANPGCHVTCSTLALAPALAAQMIGPDVIVNSLTGISGAGRGLKQNLHFSEMHDNAAAYGLDGHRHMPEIAQVLSDSAGGPVSVLFVPHLIPISRGMLATCTAKLTGSYEIGEITTHYQKFYKGSEFVRIVNTPPTIKEVMGTNYCFIYPTLDKYTGRLVVTSVIDNLVKGAAGQGIQNMNILAELPETAFLDGLGMYP